jgi:hypothetical protein
MSAWIENARTHEEDLAQEFERITNPAEIVRIASSYAARQQCEDLRIARCGSYLWVRLGHRADLSHLLFRLAETSAELTSAPLGLQVAV